MSTWIIVVIIVVAILVVLALVMAARARRRRAALRDQFGPEYDRAVDSGGSRRSTEKELQERVDRRNELDIRPLDPTTAARYRDEWRLTQERFVDAPAEAVTQAHQLVTAAMHERGYPTEERDERIAMLSVDHSQTVQRYRQGVDTEARWRAGGQTSTEELRQAMQHFRGVFVEVVGDGQPATGESQPTGTSAATGGTGSAPGASTSAPGGAAGGQPGTATAEGMSATPGGQPESGTGPAGGTAPYPAETPTTTSGQPAGETPAASPTEPPRT
jgi:hypothetical protein